MYYVQQLQSHLQYGPCHYTPIQSCIYNNIAQIYIPVTVPAMIL